VAVKLANHLVYARKNTIRVSVTLSLPTSNFYCTYPLPDGEPDSSTSFSQHFFYCIKNCPIFCEPSLAAPRGVELLNVI
jgi:hypothetical protein